MKRIFSVLLTLVLVLTCLPSLPLVVRAVTTGGICGDNLTWTLDEEGTLTISGTGAMPDYASPTETPWADENDSMKQVILETGVTRVGSNAFAECQNLICVELPNTVTELGAYAFASCYGLADIELPDSVTEIGHWAFQACFALEEIILPEGVTRLGADAFSQCVNLKRVKIPSTLKKLEENTFEMCDSLTDMEIPEGVTEIGGHAMASSATKRITLPASLVAMHGFYEKNKLEEVYFNGTTEQWNAIRTGRWDWHPNFKLYCLGGGTESAGLEMEPEDAGWIIQGIGSCVDGDVVIPQRRRHHEGEMLNVVEIAPNAFSGNTDLTTIVIPDTVTHIGSNAFANCTNLEKIYFDGTREYWDQIQKDSDWDANCPCELVIMREGKFVYNLVNNSYYTVSWTGEAVPSELVIPASYNGLPVKVICAYAFAGQAGLTSLTISEGITHIEYSAFQGCSNLKTVTIPSSMRYLHDAVFMECSSLETVQIQEGAVLNGTRIFNNCTSLKEITIPQSMSHVDMAMFAGCTSLTRVTLPENLRSIGQFAFERCTALTEFTLPPNLEHLNPMAFNHCANLTGLQVAPGGNTPYRAVDNCILLGDSLVLGCQTSRIPVDAGVTTIGSCAFCGKAGLTQITIPHGIQEINSNAFSSCPDLMQVTIPESVEQIEQCAFANCPTLKVICYEGTQEQFEQILKDYDWDMGCDYTLVCRGETYGSEGLEYTLSEDGSYYIVTGIGSCIDAQIIIPYLYEGKPVKEIAPYAFADLPEQAAAVFRFRAASVPSFTVDDILSVSIPDSVTLIGEGAFSGCDGLTEIRLGEGVSQIGSGAFENCPSLESLQVAEGNETYHSSNNCLIQTESRTLVAGCKTSRIPADGSVIDIGESAFAGCQGLTQLEIPETVTGIGSNAFAGCENLENVAFQGNAPQLAENAFSGVEANIQYPAENDTWTEAVGKDYEGTLSWTAWDPIPENAVMLPAEAFSEYDTVWVDGLPYAIRGEGEERYVEIPEGNHSLVTYTYQVGDGQDVHTQYPTGMKVYMVSDGKLTYVPELDDLLQYSGSSIRIVGKKGIRMITSLTKDNKKALTGKGLAGYKLLEYGTALCFASEIPAGDGLVLGRSYTRSNFAYKKGEADPVFASPGNLIQYTNVLVGFTLDQCKEDIAMRPYIILEDGEGNQVTLYGGTIYRSIGYIAYQNRNVFQPKTAAYDYVWELIHHVYGDKYDADYKG